MYNLALNLDFSSGIPSSYRGRFYFIINDLIIPIKELAQSALNHLITNTPPDRFQVLDNGRLIQFKGPVTVYTGSIKMITYSMLAIISFALCWAVHAYCCNKFHDLATQASQQSEGNKKNYITNKLENFFSENPHLIRVTALVCGILMGGSILYLFTKIADPWAADVELLPPGSKYTYNFWNFFHPVNEIDIPSLN